MQICIGRNGLIAAIETTVPIVCDLCQIHGKGFIFGQGRIEVYGLILVCQDRVHLKHIACLVDGRCVVPADEGVAFRHSRDGTDNGIGFVRIGIVILRHIGDLNRALIICKQRIAILVDSFCHVGNLILTDLTPFCLQDQIAGDAGGEIVGLRGSICNVVPADQRICIVFLFVGFSIGRLGPVFGIVCFPSAGLCIIMISQSCLEFVIMIVPGTVFILRIISGNVSILLDGLAVGLPEISGLTLCEHAAIRIDLNPVPDIFPAGVDI